MTSNENEIEMRKNHDNLMDCGQEESMSLIYNINYRGIDFCCGKVIRVENAFKLKVGVNMNDVEMMVTMLYS